LAAELKRRGIQKGDRVALLSENRPEWSISYLAVASLGAVNVPLDASLTTEEILNLINDSGSRVIITTRMIYEKHGLKLDPIFLDDIEDLPESQMPSAEVKPHDLLAIVYTSGTTGNAKGVMLTHNNIVTNVVSVLKSIKIGPGDNFLSVLPIHHMFETTAGLMGAFFDGGCVTYAESLKSYNLLKNMQETGVTVMCGVPLLYNLLYNGIEREVEEKGVVTRALFGLLKSLAKIFKPEPIRRKLFSMLHKKYGGKIRFFVSGGAAIDPEVIKGFELYGITILQGYGLTESSPILTFNSLGHNRVGAVGRAVEKVEIKITEQGEIIARGPNIMQGYYKRPDLTAEVLQNGWLYTGDIGRFDQDGYLYITGRSKDVIVSGAGVNIYPDEIEFFLNKVPGVKESCVLGKKIGEGLRKGMEEVWAVIVPDYEYFQKHRLEEQGKIEKHIRTEVEKLNLKLVEYKRVAKFKIRSIELPKTTTRKVRRFQVKKEMGL
jgi:long-chain acyl-CoA synthetase